MMKVYKILFILALPNISYSNTYLDFSNKIDTYQNIFERHSYNIERTYNYECSNKQVSRFTDTGEIVEDVRIITGKSTERVMDNGKTVEYEDRSDGAIFRATYKYKFLDENTLISVGERATTIFSGDEENTSRSKSKKITKLIDGKRTVISYTLDGEEQKLKSPYNIVSVDFDPFRTKYVETTTLIDFENARRGVTEIIELQNSCIYTQDKISSYLELIPEVIIGTWTDESTSMDKNTPEVTFGKDNVSFVEDIMTIVFNSDGTYTIRLRDNSTKTGMYKIDNGVVKFKDNGGTNFVDMFKLGFKNFNEFSLSIETTDSTLSIGNFKRQKI